MKSYETGVQKQSGCDPSSVGTRTEKRRVFIKTYGCQMNVYDSVRMVDVLATAGYVETQNPEDADTVLLNTCHIREKAAEKIYSELGRLRALKKARASRGQSMMVGVVGCVAQAEGQEIVRRAPVVDVVMGPQSYHRLPAFLERAEKSGRAVVETDFPVRDKFETLPLPDKKRTLARGNTAFLTVQEGCDKFCAFCVVPYTRGAEFSRPVDRILSEAQALTEAGVCEITLLGQNVNAYRGQGPDGTEWSLGRLVRTLAGFDSLQRIRYTTSHPRDMDDELVAVHGEVEKLMPYLHLPVQSGSDRILKAMNRRHTAQEYRHIIERIREARPDIGLSSDFIVGFPGETEEDFEATLALVRSVGYAQAYSFKYSPRPGTPAASAELQVDEKTKSVRLARLQALLDAQQKAFNTNCVGKTMPVLLNRRGKKEGQLVGRSPYLQAVFVEADEEFYGTIARVIIQEGHANSLSGRLEIA